MTWQGSGGPGAPGEPDDDATRIDNPVPASVPPPFTPPADDGAGATPPPGAAEPPPGLPPAAPPAAPIGTGLPPAPAPQAPSPWTAPAAGGAWAAVPPDAGRFAVPGAPGLVYAGALPRFIAYVIDVVLVGLVGTIITLPFASSAVTEYLQNPAGYDGTAGALPAGPAVTISTVVVLLIEAAYFTFLWSSGGRATLGMRLLRLQIGDATTGNRIPIATSFRRWLALGSWIQLIGFVPVLGAIASLATLGWQLILLVTTASHPQKQGLHDRFANTAMVRPVDAGSGGVIIGCILIGLLFLILPIVALIMLGSQVSTILSAVGDSV
ncbi:MAG TPA: RDD family protein [Candidatus Limnocylindrales bacterium]|nr:RDD family protein [Candidatus Limnocylindrales bacterium]